MDVLERFEGRTDLSMEELEEVYVARLAMTGKILIQTVLWTLVELFSYCMGNWSFAWVWGIFLLFMFCMLFQWTAHTMIIDRNRP